MTRKRFFLWMAIGLGVVGLAWASAPPVADALERLLVYHPYAQMEGSPADLKLPFEEVQVRAEDGAQLFGWWVPADGARWTLLFSHGNAGNISHRLEKLAIFHRLGCNVLLYDYRGYGRSGGAPQEQGLYADARAMHAYLTATRKIPAEQIIAVGESLGSVISAHLAAERPVGAVVLEGVFTSLADMAAASAPFLAGLAGDRFNTLASMPKITAPLLVMHSAEDEMIPVAQAEKVFAAAREPKTLVRLRGGHNDAFLESGALFADSLRAFLAGLPEKPAPPPAAPLTPPVPSETHP